MIELTRMPQTASMQDIKNRIGEVTAHLAPGPVLLMNRAAPQAVIVSTEQWNAIVNRFEEMQDAIITLQAELAIATGQSEVEKRNSGYYAIHRLEVVDDTMAGADEGYIN